MANQDVTLPSGYSSELAIVKKNGRFDGSIFNTNGNFRRCYIIVPNKCSKVLLRSEVINDISQWVCADINENDISQYTFLGAINGGKIGETIFDIPSGYKYLMVQHSPTTGKDVYVEFLK